MIKTRPLSAALFAALTAAVVLAGTAALLAGSPAARANRLEPPQGTVAQMPPMPSYGGPGAIPDQTIWV
ncbi:MAG: hypothetical protein E6H03_10350, partial [Bacillati bacterium ANGP1]